MSSEFPMSVEACSSNIMDSMLKAGFSIEEIEYSITKALRDGTEIHPDPKFEEAYQKFEEELQRYSATD